MAVKRWNGTTWDVYAGADTSPGFAATDGRSGRRTYVGANTPTAPVDGDIWIDQDTATNSIPASAFDAKGDLMVGTGPDTYTRQAVGTDGQVLVADSSQADGILWSHAPSRQGLVNVVPTSVTVGSGSASVSSNGTITIGSAVTSIAVNGVFSSAHENYKILLHLDNHNGGASVEFQLQGITSGYFTTGYYMSFGTGTVTGYSSASTDRWYCNFNNQSTYSSAFQMDLVSPNLAKRKVCAVTGQGANGPSQISGTNNSATQSTGFTITKSSDTMTGGTIRIYGYGNGA